MATNKFAPNAYAAVIKFKKDATPAEIAKALNSIKHLIDPAWVPAKWSDMVKHYYDGHGDPVFYVP